ncbi:OmpA family protein [Flavobacterium sp. CS20]|uniref:OmpA family protein n=1 Tax=Flavobacterium sp. CS20 TaxID=2775246 RepID=UPI001B3A6E5B|nr:OmpA family protein [Flavobacterium sp. CS20]QTY27553.1 OmpA family protein [Flavobacterium sp. CS20]
MSKSILICISFCVFLFACGNSKKAVEKKPARTSEYINPKSDMAIAGSVNFDNNESLTIYSAIIKNITGDKPGAYIGNEMDKLAEQLQNKLDYSELLRVGEGLILEFNSKSNFYFNTGKTNLNSESRQNLDVIVSTLKQYPKVNLIIETHTDASGDEDVNMKLSQERVLSIKNYLLEKGIDSSRIKTKAFGENQPKVNNETLENRQLNRRVDFGFYASDALKEEAINKTQ